MKERPRSYPSLVILHWFAWFCLRTLYTEGKKLESEGKKHLLKRNVLRICDASEFENTLPKSVCKTDLSRLWNCKEEEHEGKTRSFLCTICRFIHALLVPLSFVSAQRINLRTQLLFYQVAFIVLDGSGISQSLYLFTTYVQLSSNDDFGIFGLQVEMSVCRGS